MGSLEDTSHRRRTSSIAKITGVVGAIVIALGFIFFGTRAEPIPDLCLAKKPTGAVRSSSRPGKFRKLTAGDVEGAATGGANGRCTGCMEVYGAIQDG